MLGFGRGSSVEVTVNGMAIRFDDKMILKMAKENVEMRNSLNQLEANHDEMARKIKVLEDRLATANAKLKEFGNPGLF